MGKRGKGKRGNKKRLDADLDEELNNYEPSESEEEFGKDEKILLDNRRGRKKNDDSEEEVFGIHSSSDEDYKGKADQFYGGGVGSDLDSDIEGADKDKDSEDGLPDSKAWGKGSGKYYNTDYVDKDFGGMSKEDEELAEMEEQEAANIQKRLMSHMVETDFTMGLLDKVKEKMSELNETRGDIDDSEKIISDLSNMSPAERMQLLKLESPEVLQLLDDFIEYMALAKDKLMPIRTLVFEGKLEPCAASEFVLILFVVILNYCLNIVYYLMLKSRRTVPVDNHPVVQRLYTFKKLLDEMFIVLEDKLMDQINFIIETYNRNAELELSNPVERVEPPPRNRAERRKRKLKVLEEAKIMEKSIKKKKAKLEAKKGDERPDDISSSDVEEEEFEQPQFEESEEEDEDGEAKRAITYEMKKNKGLTPRRKKEDRNPRVKNRNKFRKAVIRRKGQIQKPRTEVTKYGGEMSGIKAYVSKSVKFKY